MSIINTIFLDMDGVLCDFRGACIERKCIEGTNVEWNVISAEGAKFWESLNWLPNSEQFFKWLKQLCEQEDIELYILSAVNPKYAPAGKMGKINWCVDKLGIDRHHIIIVNHGHDKRIYSNEHSLLIDDYVKNCEAFKKHISTDGTSGQAVLFKNPSSARVEIMKLLGMN